MFCKGGAAGNILFNKKSRKVKKYNIKGQLFTDSYKYYMTDPDTMKEILDEAQKIIVSKDPNAEAFINKKLKENSGIPAQAR